MRPVLLLPEIVTRFLSDLNESGIKQNDIDVLVLSKCQGQTLNKIIDVEGTSLSQFPMHCFILK